MEWSGAEKASLLGLLAPEALTRAGRQIYRRYDESEQNTTSSWVR